MAREMKDSGIMWIGEIPSNWEVHPVGIYFAERIHKNSFGQESNLLSLSYGKIVHKDINAVGGLLPASYNTYNIIEPGDIIIRPTDLQNDKKSLRTGLSKDHGIVTSAYIALKPINGAFSPFYHYLLHCYDTLKVFYNMGNGVRQGLNYSEFSKLLLLIPTLPEQKAIADFLDKKCAEIDGLLADLEAEVKTLAEYKKSIIAETVTRGLNPNAPMKQSGIPWAETIPAHWDIQKGKYTFRLLQRPVKEDDGIITCFRDGEVTLRSNRREDGFTMSAKEYGYQGIEPGDLVVHGMDGFAGSIGISDSRGKGTPVLNVLDSKYNKRYLMYYLRNMAYGDVFLALSTGIRVRSCDLGWKKLGEIRIVLPPIEEQEKIADYIDHKLDEIQNAIVNKTQQIETLKAYKSSLIYEYVTGKKQVI
jgi:type I restriction enzyme S subunit